MPFHIAAVQGMIAGTGETARWFSQAADLGFMLPCGMWQTAIQHVQSEFVGTLSSAADWALSAALLVGAAIAAFAVARCRSCACTPNAGRPAALPANAPRRD
jgi:hypothetical protein